MGIRSILSVLISLNKEEYILTLFELGTAQLRKVLHNYERKEPMAFLGSFHWISSLLQLRGWLFRKTSILLTQF